MSVVIPSLRAAVAVPGWAKNVLWRSARALPSLDLRFADNKSLVDAVTGASLVTFTRASSGTFVDSAGVLRTAATDVPRFDHNPTTGESLGLLVEEQRTNLRLNSATYQPTSGGSPAAYTVDQVAPDGTTTGSRQTAATPRTFEDYTGIANALYTFSFYCRVTSGTVAFSIQLKNAATDTVITSDTSPVATTTWRRFTISGTTAGATPGARVELVGVVPGFVFWGAQLEAGAFPTSYIPTTTAAATRSADVASITGTAFSSWYRQDEGTMFASVVSAPNNAIAQVCIDISDAIGNERMFMRRTGAGSLAFAVIDGAVAQADVGAGPVISGGALFATAASYRLNNINLATSGQIGTEDTSATIPTPDRMFIAQNFASTQSLNGTIRRLVYWGQRLPNNVLQAITQ